MKTMHEVLTDALSLDDTDVRMLVQRLIKEQRERIRRKSMAAQVELRMFDEVENVSFEATRKLPPGVRGRITRFSGMFVVVDFGPYRTWKVPGHWLKKIEKKAEVVR